MPKDMGDGWIRYSPNEEIPRELLAEEGMTSEDWRDWNEHKKARKRKNFGTFTGDNHAALIEQQTGLVVQQCQAYHYKIRDVGGYVVDYWPSTRKWRYKNKTHFGKVESLIGFINNRQRQKEKHNGTTQQHLPQQQTETDSGRTDGEAGN